MGRGAQPAGQPPLAKIKPRTGFLIAAPLEGPAIPFALITGASSGIGEAFAEALAVRGYDLCLVARRGEVLRVLADRLSAAHGVQALVLPADLSAVGAAEAVLAQVAAQDRQVDMLVNNAGYSIPQSFAAVPWERQRDFLMTLVVNACGLAHGVIGSMAARGGGSIINVASLAGFAPGVAGHSLYPGAKSLMISFSQALAAEYGPAGVRVTALCPGFVKTGFAAANGTQAVMDQTSRRLFHTPAQVAAAALAANDRGQIVVIPGWWNALAAGLMRLLPMGLVRAILMRGSARYHLDAQD